MQILSSKSPDFSQKLQAIFQRSAFDPEIDRNVEAILKDVRTRGDQALVEYAARFDHVTLTPDRFAVSPEEIAQAVAATAPEVKEAILAAKEHITAFSRQRIPQDWSFSPRPGVTVGEQFTPLDRVACYIPGGTAPLVSTVLHTAAIASTAGVRELCVVTPARADGTVNPTVLCACAYAGVNTVYRLGGVYGVAAMAYGTQTIRKVQKIVGPGNAYVTSAKRQLYGEVSLDLVAGPSEILVLADDTASPAYIAADLLSQAEHGSTREKAVLITTAEAMIPEVQEELKRQTAQRDRQACIEKVLENGVYLIAVPDLDTACSLADQFAPEHLEVMTRTPRDTAAKLHAAGAIFLGPWTPEPVGDFVAGPSHVLPTGGSAQYFSGLTVEMFFRRSSIVEYTKEALATELPWIEQFATQEGLDGHGRSASIRLRP